MSKGEKAREFWILENNGRRMILDKEFADLEVSEKIHVIEAEALEQKDRVIQELEKKIQIAHEETGICLDCLDAKVKGYTICGDCAAI